MKAMKGVFDRSILPSLVAAALLGLAAVIAPVWLLPLKPYPAPLFPVIRTGWEGLSALTLIFLFSSGVLLGWFGRSHPFLLGVATVALLPCAALAEMLVSPTSHRLWPFEFMLYGLISLVAVLGAFVGRLARKRFCRRAI